MPSLQQGRGLMKSLGLVRPERIRSLKLKYHDFYAAMQPDSVESESIASDCLLYGMVWNVLHSYSSGHKTLFLRPERITLWRRLLMLAYHPPCCLLGWAWDVTPFHVPSFSCIHFSIYHWYGPLESLFAMDISGPFSVSLLAHIKRLTQIRFSYLCFEGGSFTKDDQLVTCN